jgi:hypothetical protein
MKRLLAMALVLVLLVAVSMAAYQQGASSASSPINLRPGQKISVGYDHHEGSGTVFRQEGSWVLISDLQKEPVQRWINLDQAEWVNIQ